MRAEDQVTSLELSKRLKELNVKQESYFYWLEMFDENGGSRGYEIVDILNWGECKGVYANDAISAYTVAELGVLLPDYCGTLRDWNDGFTVYCYEKLENGNNIINHYHTNDTEANARAKALIYLIENDLIKTE